MEIAVIIALSLLLAAETTAFAVTLHRNAARADAVSDKDTATKLLNRDGFMRCGEELLRRTAPFQEATPTLIVFDVDQLGKINTLFGTEAGDSVVAGFAAALRSISKASDIVSRVNTDDFALLTCCGSEEINGIIDSFSENLSQRFANKTLCEQVCFNAGVCVYDGHDDIYTMFNKANLCLLMRQEGCRLTFFNGEMEHRMVETEMLRTEMADALETGQFELYYQPKVSFKTGQMLGAEALIRWHHPTMGFVPPDKFIPLAEKTGIITKIDEWGLFTACRQCKKWQEEGLNPVKVSVNMSQAQFYRTDVYSTIRNALAQTGLDPKYLEIEVTETMAMQDIDKTIDVLGRIHSLGVSISMDDFGSGYSSLSSLKMIPLDILKIDRSLVCDIEQSDVSKQITGAIVDLGKAMELVVLAEGVETHEQCEFLSNIGCDLAQGYYYSAPKPASEIESMLVMPVASTVST